MKIKELRKSYQVSGHMIQVLKGLNLELDDQGITVILGRSGCGKTTLLRLVAGLEKADSGTIQWTHQNGADGWPEHSGAPRQLQKAAGRIYDRRGGSQIS